MSKWSTPEPFNQLQGISTSGPYGCIRNDGVNPTSAVWPTAKKVLYVPFSSPGGILVNKLRILNGAAVSGNVDAGIYTKDGVRLTNTGSTAHAGVSAWQVIDTADRMLWADAFYFALTFDNITAAMSRWIPGTGGLPEIAVALGIRYETTGSFGLPATATWSPAVDAYLPSMGLLVGGVL